MPRVGVITRMTYEQREEAVTIIKTHPDFTGKQLAEKINNDVLTDSTLRFTSGSVNYMRKKAEALKSNGKAPVVDRVDIAALITRLEGIQAIGIKFIAPDALPKLMKAPAWKL